MHLHANYASISVFGYGDYYQATFETEQDVVDPGSPYGIVNLAARGMLVVSVAGRLGSEGPLLAYCVAPL
jgi:hypothetical protein